MEFSIHGLEGRFVVESDLFIMAIILFTALLFLAFACHHHEETPRMGPFLLDWDLAFIALFLSVLGLFYLICIFYIG
jgi:hypothetical protein